MIFSGLLVDSQQGIIFQQPLILFLGLIGVVPLAKANLKRFVFLCLIFLSINIPNSMHTNWYGGYSFWGRFGWASSVLWVFPISHATRKLAELKWGKFYFYAVCIGSLVLQFAYVSTWIRQNNYLYNTNIIQQWANSDLISDVFAFPIQTSLWLPYFHNYKSYLYHLPNLLAIFGCMIVLSIGFVFFISGKKFKLLVGSLAILALSAIGVSHFSTSSFDLTPVVFAGNQLPGQIGRIEGGKRIALEGEKGYLSLGPYIKLKPNNTYQFTLNFQESNSTIASWDIAVNGGTILLGGDLKPTDPINNSFKVNLDLRNESIPNTNFFEFRVKYEGYGTLEIDSIEIIPVTSGS